MSASVGVSEALLQEFPLFGEYVGSCCSTSAWNNLWFLSLSTQVASVRPYVCLSRTVVLALALRTYSDSLPCWPPQVPRLSLTHSLCCGGILGLTRGMPTHPQLLLVFPRYGTRRQLWCLLTKELRLPPDCSIGPPYLTNSVLWRNALGQFQTAAYYQLPGPASQIGRGATASPASTSPSDNCSPFCSRLSFQRDDSEMPTSQPHVSCPSASCCSRNGARKRRFLFYFPFTSTDFTYIVFFLSQLISHKKALWQAEKLAYY